MAVTTDTKRKIPLPIPATTLIKIETDATTLDQTKTLQAVSTIGSNTGTVFTDPNMTPLVTTHVIYQHPTNLILTNENQCRSQATSPVACLTPPPENLLPVPEEETHPASVQDASNQTDIPIGSEDDTITLHTLPELVADLKAKFADEEPKVDTQEKELAAPVVMKPLETTTVAEIIEPAIAEVPKIVTETVPESAGKPKYSPQETQTVKPDLSGLELLSNSIVEFENCRKSNEQLSVVKQERSKPEQGEEVLQQIAHMTLKDTENETVIIKNVDDSLGGLDLLCALAEQRILEEVDEKNKNQYYKEKKAKDASERKKEKRKSKRRHPDEPRHKKNRANSEKEGTNVDECDNVKPKCFCIENYRSYKSAESKEEVRKFIASKSQSSCCKGEFPCMNAMEIDMRMKLADLQRQYREKQRELSKLKPKKHTENGKKSRSRKKSTNSDRSATPPPLLDKMDVPIKPNRNVPDLLKPPTLCAETIKIPKSDHEYKRHHSSNDSTPEKRSSSKKRKVGRPKKLLSSSGLRITTETIVAKKPKKGSLVRYLLAAKEKLKLQHKNGLIYSENPPRYVEETNKTKHKSHKNKNHDTWNKVDGIKQAEKSCKIRPKLKAEPTVKTYKEEEDVKTSWCLDSIEEEEEDAAEEEYQAEPPEEEEEEEVAVQSEELPKPTEPPVAEPEEKKMEVPKEPSQDVAKPTDSRCCLTAENLEVDKLRVLTAMGGLFYAGHLTAVEPPDVYSITLDGERGNRPHIMSREEILRDTVSSCFV